MKLGRLAGIGAVATSLVAALATAPASAVTITEFPANPGKSASPFYIASGPEGNLWWTERGAEVGIMRISPGGERLPIIATPQTPYDLVVGPSGWASWTTPVGTGARSPAGTVTNNAEGGSASVMILTPNNQIRWGRDQGFPEICSGSKDNVKEGVEGCGYPLGSFGRVMGLGVTQGAVWASYFEEDVVRIWNTTLNAIIKKVDLPAGSGPDAIAIGPEGNAWVAMYEAAAIDRIGIDGTRTRFFLPPGSEPHDLVLGPDGALWFTEYGTNKIGRMTTTGVLTEYPVPTANAEVVGITVGPDGALWFTEFGAGKIGRLVPDPLAPPADTVAPSFLGKPSFSPKTFRVAGKGEAHASGKGGAPIGTKLKFSLSEAAKVKATIARKVVRHKKARYVKVGALTSNAKQGANKVLFSGKLKGKRLAPGSYRATLTARDGAGNVSTPKTASFSIVR